MASDVDLLVVLDDDADRAALEDRVRNLAYDVELEAGVVLSAIEYEREPDGPASSTFDGMPNGSLGEVPAGEADRELVRPACRDGPVLLVICLSSIDAAEVPGADDAYRSLKAPACVS